MKAEVIKTVEVVLYLHELDARWLMDLVQNPISEDHDDNAKRKELFTTLKEALK